jgi:hypothetical protein
MATDHPLLSLFGFGGPTPPPVLYHYTSMQGLLSIVETGRMRASHVRFLNDSSEISAMWSVVFGRLRERMDSVKSTVENTYLAEVIKLAESRPLSNEFIASFSEKDDDLSQWRSYCPGGAGFSIGFSSAAVRSQWVANPTGGEPSFVGAKLLKVLYLNEGDTFELDRTIDAIFQLASHLHGSMGFHGLPISREQIVPAWLSMIAPSYKNSAFRDESEWRLVLNKPHKPMPGQRFREGKSMIIPYVEVELDRDLHFKHSEEYMIRRVVVGPTPNADLSTEALQSLFLSKGHSGVHVEKSSIPYRHW